jgi:hypothetical protein
MDESMTELMNERVKESLTDWALALQFQMAMDGAVGLCWFSACRKEETCVG